MTVSSPAVRSDRLCCRTRDLLAKLYPTALREKRGLRCWKWIALTPSFPLLSTAQQPLVGQGLLIVEVSRSHSDTPHSVGLLWTSDRPYAKTYAWNRTTITRDRQQCPPAAGFEPAIPATRSRRPTPYTARAPGSADTPWPVILLQRIIPHHTC